VQIVFQRLLFPRCREAERVCADKSPREAVCFDSFLSAPLVARDREVFARECDRPRS
jgi:hypothetical protein